jgi:hypothetical protein
VEHSTQLQCYLNILNLPEGVVLYEDKNNQMVKTFVVKRSDDLWNNIIARGEKIMNMVAPPKLAEVSRVHPSYCDCKGVSDEELGIA